MTDSAFSAFESSGSASNIDTRTEATSGNHRQVVVLGDPAVNNNVAAVLSQDVGGNDQSTPALAVRIAGSASVSIASASGTIGVHVGSTGGTLAVALKPGTIAVSLDPGYELGSIKGINSSIAAHILSTGGTIGVALKPGTIAVSLDPGYTLGNVGSVTSITNSIAAHILSTGGTLAVALKPGTIAVSLDPGYTLGNVGSVTSITNSIAAHILSTGGTLNVQLKPGTIAVQLDPGHLLGNIGTVASITASIAAHILSTNGTMAVDIGKTAGTITVRTDPGYELGSIRGINSSISAHILSTGGSLNVKLDPSYNVVNQSSTITIPIVASGSASGISVSGNTIFSPVTSRVLKVYAIALTTTAQVGITAKFTNGAGTGPTEYWRYALQAPSQGIAGANLSVTPPAYLFAIASGATLAMVLDSASLVHYSVSAFRESA